MQSLILALKQVDTFTMNYIYLTQHSESHLILKSNKNHKVAKIK